MAKAKSKPLFEADFGANGGIRQFYSLKEAEEFVNSEMHSPIGQIVQTVFGGVSWNFISNASSTVSNARNDPNYINELPARFAHAFGTEQPQAFPPTFSPRGKFLQKVYEQHGKETATAALAYYVDRIGDVTRNRATALGLHLAVEFDLGERPETESAYGDAFGEIAQEATKQHRLAAADIEELLAEAGELRDETIRRVRKSALRITKRHYDQIRNVKTQFEDAKADIKNVEETYRTQMGLQAPVEYWNKKARSHTEKARTYRRILTAFAIFMGGALGWLLYEIAGRIVLEAGKTAGAGAIAYAGIGLFVTTIVFWAARIMVRLFMSEHHLAIDAEERAIMVETYLALKLKEQVGPDDLKLVLAGLFRPTSDGIVKDDGAPEMGLASLLSKAASGNR